MAKALSHLTSGTKEMIYLHLFSRAKAVPLMRVSKVGFLK